VRRLAARAAEAGAELREHERVESLDELEADQVVVATDGYTQGLIPELDEAVTPTRRQVLVTEPLERQLFPCPHYARHGYDYWQQTAERRPVAGGFRDKAPDHENTAEEHVTPLVQGHLERFVTELLGEPPQITQRWAGMRRCLSGARRCLGLLRLLGPRQRDGPRLRRACGKGRSWDGRHPSSSCSSPARLLTR